MLTQYSKTQDVLEYVCMIKDTLAQVSIFWVHAGSRARFEQDYRKLSKLVELPGCDDPKEDIRPTVKCWFESLKSGDWILVLDNADNKADFFAEEGASNGLAQFIPRRGHGTVILTTRDFWLADELADSNVLLKDMMQEAQAEQLLAQHYPAAIHHEPELIVRCKPWGTRLQHIRLAALPDSVDILTIDGNRFDTTNNGQ